MIFSRLFKADQSRDAGRALYEAAVGQARAPVFYADMSVPDTIDGRFEAILLHVWLLLQRMRREEAPADALNKVSQAVFDSLIADMDRSLREMGVGDLRVGKRVKAMARSFYGHVEAYDAALAGGVDALAPVLARNVYGTATDEADNIGHAARQLAQYVENSAASLEKQAIEDIIVGKVTFTAPESGESR